MATAKKQVLQALVVNAETGEEYLRDLTEEELAEHAARAAAEDAAHAAREAKAAARASALAKLAELGLTEEEIAAL